MLGASTAIEVSGVVCPTACANATDFAEVIDALCAPSMRALIEMPLVAELAVMVVFPARVI